MRSCVALIAFLILGSATAWADGEGGSLKDVPGVAVADEWSGFSVGVGVGAGKIDQSLSADATRKDWLKKTKCSYWWPSCYTHHEHDFREIDEQFTDDDWKVFGTVQVGYDRLIRDHFLIGAFADFDFYPDGDESFSRQESFYKYGKYSSGTLSGDISQDGIWTVGGRVGALLRPNLLVYGLGGYSQMNLSGSVTADFDDPFFKSTSPYALPSHLSLQLPDHLNGWTVGGGFETKLDRIDKRLSLKFEYRFSHFDGADATVSGGDSVSGCSSSWWGTTEINHGYHDKLKVSLDDTDVQSVRAVLVWKLTADAAPIVPLK